MLEIQIFYLLKLLLCETHRGLSSIQAGKSVLQVHWSEQTKYYNLYRNMFSRTFTVWHTTYPHTHTHTRKQICWWCWHIAYCKLFSPFVRRWHECAAIIHIRRNSDRSVWHPPRHFLMSHDALDDTLWWESDGEIRVRCHSTDWIFIFTMKENSTELKTHFKELYAPHFCLVARTTYLHCITLNLPLNTLYGDAVLMILTLFLYGHRSIQL